MADVVTAKLDDHVGMTDDVVDQANRPLRVAAAAVLGCIGMIALFGACGGTANRAAAPAWTSLPPSPASTTPTTYGAPASTSPPVATTTSSSTTAATAPAGSREQRYTPHDFGPKPARSADPAAFRRNLFGLRDHPARINRLRWQCRPRNRLDHLDLLVDIGRAGTRAPGPRQLHT